jgi:hypothetical protein
VIPDYLLIGHITADIVPSGRMLGGTVSYAAPVAKGFNYNLGIITSGAPNEPLFDILKPYLAEYIFHAASATSTFENIYQNGGRTQYLHHRAAPLTPDLVPDDWQTRASGTPHR